MHLVFRRLQKNQEMFEEDISVRLESYKLTKSKNLKTQMNVTVEYRGHKYNNIDELSGGEKQRCELAFLLAVNDMLGSQIILLDECLNNLDSGVNMDVLLQLKKLVGNRLVMVVSHEAVQGVFDHTIEVGPDEIHQNPEYVEFMAEVSLRAIEDFEKTTGLSILPTKCFPPLP